MNKTIGCVIIAGGLGLLPGLNAISQGMDESEGAYLSNPKTTERLEKAWISIETQKQIKGLSSDEIQATDSAKAVLTEINSLLKEDWHEGEETFEEFVKRVPGFFPPGDINMEALKALSPYEAKECIKDFKAAMYQYKSTIETMIIMQYENYGKDKQDFLNLFKNDPSDPPQDPIADNGPKAIVMEELDEVDVKYDENRGLSYIGTPLSEFPPLTNAQKIENIMKTSGLSYNEARDIVGND